MYKLSERAWERKVILLSSNITHLDTGILLTLTPDLKAMGRRIGEMVKTLANDSNASLKNEAVTVFRVGVNLRVAHHLDISISEDNIERFDVVLK